MSSLLLTNQFFVIGTFCLIGSVATLILFLKGNNKNTWKVADLLWIGAGGFSAFMAIAISVVLADMTNVRRNSDVFTSKVSTFHEDTKAYLGEHCSRNQRMRSIPVISENLSILCNEIELMSRQTAADASLVRYASIFATSHKQENTYLYSNKMKELAFLAGEQAQVSETRRRSDRSRTLNNLEVGDLNEVLPKFFLFPSDLRPEEEVALIIATLLNTGLVDRLCHQFNHLRTRFSQIEDESSKLEIEWRQILQQQNLFIWRLLAVCVLAFVFPLRIGKSINELLKSSN